jgi:WD40 repeat protein
VLGNVGKIDLTTFTTTRVLTGVSATAIVFDPFTGDLSTAGIDGIAQIDRASGTVVSTWTNPEGNGSFIQNLSVTTQGHLIALSGDGSLHIWDFTSGSGLIGQPYTIEESVTTSVLSGGLELAATGAPVITSPSEATATVDRAFVYQIEAIDATSQSASNLPPGLVYDAALAAIVGSTSATGRTGTISGTPSSKSCATRNPASHSRAASSPASNCSQRIHMARQRCLWCSLSRLPV